MRRFAIGLILLSAVICYFTEINQEHEIHAKIEDISGSLPFPIWLITFGFGLVFFGISIATKTENEEPKRPQNRKPLSRPTHTVKRNFTPTPPKDVQQKQGETSKESNQVQNDFIEEIPTQALNIKEVAGDMTRATTVALIKKRAAAIDWPRGANLKIDTGKNTPFTLRLEGITPGAAKRAIKEYGTFLFDIPTPRRACVQLIKIIDSGIPMHRIIQGIITPILKGKAFTLTSQIDGVDIRFQKPDEFWAVSGNLEKDF